ncbi:MAG: M48 family metallopeptidase [Acidimicrobiia bacterium]|nr:M48 family metallopeptidase [Acidimicrobiia bacterium]
MKIEVVRSTRRRKTVQAQLVDGVLRIAIPDHLTEEEEAHWVERMRVRFEPEADPGTIDLEGRAGKLATRFGLPRPSSITWSNRQRTIWGSCTIDTGAVRISARVAAFPGWVLDYVIVHELAHLVEADHGPAFWEIVNRYPMAERARGYLIAKGDAAGE